MSIFFVCVKFGDNEMLLAQGTNEIVKLLVPHEIYWWTGSNFEHWL